MKKDDAKLAEEAVMVDFYNLLLNPDIKIEERELLLDYKQSLSDGRDFSLASYNLCRDLQRLSMRYVQTREGLSAPVKAFYNSLNGFLSSELRNNEIAKGLIMASGLWL